VDVWVGVLAEALAKANAAAPALSPTIMMRSATVLVAIVLRVGSVTVCDIFLRLVARPRPTWLFS